MEAVRPTASQLARPDSGPASGPEGRRSSRLVARQGASLLLAGALALGLTACGASSSSDSAVGGAVSRDSMSKAEGAAPDSAAGAVAPDTVRAAANPMLVKRADTAIVVKDVTAAVAEIRGIATTSGGALLSESVETSSGSVDSAKYATLTIQVPADKLDDTLARLDKLGEVAARHTNTDDVSATYVDTEARVASMRTSVERMRTLMAQATAIQDIVTIESELSRRQADLEALEAQMRSLKDQVAMSPISIRLTTDRVDLGSDGGGFLGGLKAGWSAFIASVNFLLMAAGALLPFAAAAAIVLVPLIMWLRRRNRHGHLPPAGPASPALVPAQPTPTAPMASAAVGASAPTHPAPTQPPAQQPPTAGEHPTP